MGLYRGYIGSYWETKWKLLYTSTKVLPSAYQPLSRTGRLPDSQGPGPLGWEVWGFRGLGVGYRDHMGLYGGCRAYMGLRRDVAQ